MEKKNGLLIFASVNAHINRVIFGKNHCGVEMKESIT